MVVTVDQIAPVALLPLPLQAKRTSGCFTFFTLLFARLGAYLSCLFCCRRPVNREPAGDADKVHAAAAPVLQPAATQNSPFEQAACHNPVPSELRRELGVSLNKNDRVSSLRDQIVNATRELSAEKNLCRAILNIARTLASFENGQPEEYSDEDLIAHVRRELGIIHLEYLLLNSAD